jgi:undecaprenyl-diphosphatase
VLANHRRALLYSAALLLVTAAVFVGVGRHPPLDAPTTTFAPIGHLDLRVLDLVERIRTDVITWLARVLNVLGAGIFTIPFRAAIAIWLAVARRWRAFAVWVLTWITAEALIEVSKAFYHRGRPPAPLVATVGFSFPSGHAVAAASIAVALVLVLVPPGHRRRKWEWLAAGFAFVMALSRVYLNAHWFSDVVAGVLLGTVVALTWAGILTELRDVMVRRSAGAASPGGAAPEGAAPGGASPEVGAPPAPG